MFRATLLTLLIIAGFADAHFVFIVPEAGKAGKAIIVFSEDLAPDGNVDIAKIEGFKLSSRDAAGKSATVKAAKAKSALELTVPEGSRLLYGSHDYGVMQRGEGKPFLLRYHAKAVVGDGGAAKVGDALPLEVMPVVDAGKVRFQVLAAGKPLANADVTIAEGAEGTKKVTTDADGLTPAFPATGRFGLWAKFIESKAGSAGDKGYEEIRHYSSLVIDFPKR